MPKKGREFLLKYDAGGGNFQTLAGFQANTASVSNEMVEITDKDSKGFRELLEGAGTQSLTLSGNGVFEDTLTQNAVRTAAHANTHMTLQMIEPAGKTIQGEFGLASLEETGDHNTELNFSVTFESSGEWSYT